MASDAIYRTIHRCICIAIERERERERMGERERGVYLKRALWRCGACNRIAPDAIYRNSYRYIERYIHIY